MSSKVTSKNRRGRFEAMKISRSLLVVLCALVSWQTGRGQQARADASSEQPKPHAEAATGKITGRVVGDGGRTLANASVVARTVGGAGALLMSATDTEGNFELTGLPPAAYLLSAFAPGYVVEAATAQQPAILARPGETLTIKMVKGGVITGQVLDAAGNPLVAARVHVLRVRDAQGQPVRLGAPKRDVTTDDRGIYRHYGLEPGAYLVSVGGSGNFNTSPMSVVNESPSYYPASTRSMATEVVVGERQEISGINIQQRSQRGYTVSGYLSGLLKAEGTRNITVALVNASNGVVEALLSSNGEGNNRAFAFYGVPEGEYELTAQSSLGTEDAAIAPARHASVNGRDAAPVELTLQPLGSVAGRITLEPSRRAEPNTLCTGRRSARLEESIIQLRRGGAEAGRAAEPLRSVFTPASDTTPDAKGAFVLRDLPAGRYILRLDLPNQDWFVRAVTASGGAPNQTQMIDAARNGLTLAVGEHLEGLTVSIGDGASYLHGRVTTSLEGTSIPARMLVYMMPAERVQAENSLRYTAAPVQSDGTFSFEHVAPGRYWLAVRTVSDEPTSSDVQTLFADARARTRLLGEAEAANHLVELQPCQRVNDFTLHLTPPATAATN